MKPEPTAVPEVLSHDHGRFYFDITNGSGKVIARVTVSSWRAQPGQAEAIARKLATAYVQGAKP